MTGREVGVGIAYSMTILQREDDNRLLQESMVVIVRRKKLLQQRRRRVSNKTTLSTMGRILLQGEEEIQNLLLASCRGEEIEESLMLIAVRSVPVTSTGNKNYEQTGGTVGTSHSETAQLQQKQNKLPCCNLFHPLFLLHSFTLSVEQLLEQLFLLSYVLNLLFAILTLLFSSLISLGISASCSGRHATGASQVVLIPAPEESPRQR